MQLDPKIIKLGGREWTIRPLTIRQLKMIDPIVRDRNISDLSFEDLTLIISAALSRDYPDEKVDDIEAVPVEIGNAISTILILGCFVQVAPGEAKAAEAAA